MIFPATAAAIRDAGRETDGYVSFRLAGERLGVSVVRVQEVLTAQAISPVPLAPPEVAGFLNLRGQIVTAVDLRVRMGLPPRSGDQTSMNIVVRHQDELFSLLVDEVGDVVGTEASAVEPAPSTLASHWRACAEGVIRLEGELLVVLDVDNLLGSHASV
jgi:purine-binding chemotaxis protein CheW